MGYWLIVLSIVIAALGIYYYLFRYFNFFKRHGIIHIPSVPILGVMAPIIFRQMSFVDISQKIYNFNRDAKYIGIYATTKPVLLIRDLKLIKDVLIKNFDTFINRPAFNEHNEHVLSQNLFALQNTKWRYTKHLLCFAFTFKNMKIMFDLMSKCAVDLTEFMSTLPADKSDVNVKDVFDRYTNDVIALCCYGIKLDSIRNPTNEFFTCGKEITHMSTIRTMKYIFNRTFPKLAQVFGTELLNNQEMKYFKNSIKNEIAFRDTEHITRPDMIQLMMDDRGKDDRRQLDIDDMIAQAYVFYFAGFETSSSVISFLTYNIATNLNVQLKLRQEIDELLNELDGNVTYEAINQLKYLDATVKEGLRIFSASILERVCNKTYELPPALPGEKPFTIHKGMTIWIPLHAIHHDEKYYNDPEEFCPERFLDNYDSSFYFPFGLGPRTCIGKRLGIMIIKVALFHLLARCELKRCAKTLPITLSKKKLLMIPEDEIWLNIQIRSDMHPALKNKKGIVDF